MANGLLSILRSLSKFDLTNANNNLKHFVVSKQPYQNTEVWFTSKDIYTLMSEIYKT